ncbi:alginate lyase family protein [Undibacterium sp. Ji67W]|uniref:alginate lyase family protein n=1 Tax=Undibacterium sp. Ji67W TaxID=3413042 RepID=UPI003BF3D5C8
MKPIFLLTFTASMLISPIVSASGSNLWLTDADMESLRAQPARTAALIHHCDKEIDIAASPVSTFAPPPHYTSDGVVETDASKRFASDGAMAWRAALCYVVTQNPRYAKHAQAIIAAWADTLREVKSEQGVSEINFDLPQYILAASIVRGVEHWDDKSFRHLMTDIALPLSHINRKNNHANWGVFLNSAIAAYTGNRSLLDHSRDRWLALMDSEVAPDGSLPLEICRSDTNDYCGGARKGINGLSYTHYTLLPTTAGARIFDLAGRSVWQTPQGNKLASAYRMAAAWTLRPETFPYFDSNGGHLNGVRNAAYFALLQRIYPNDDGAQAINSGINAMNGLEWTLVFQ